VIGRRVVIFVVDTDHDCAVNLTLCWRRDDNLLGAGIDVRLALLAAGEHAGALDNHVNTQVTPGQLAGFLLGQALDNLAVNNQVVAVDLDLARELAVVGVIAQQVRHGFDIAQVVKGHNLSIRVRLVCDA